MPRIRPYVSDNSPAGEIQGRRAQASDFSVAPGAMVLSAGLERTGDVIHEQAVRDEVTQVRVQMAKDRAEWDVRFRDEATAAKPDDKDFASRFTQSFSDYVAKGRDQVQTREGRRAYDQLSAELTGHFSEKAGLYQVQLAGVKASQDWQVSSKAYATSVMTDPTSYGAVLNQALSELRDPNGQYGRLDAKTRSELEIKARDTLAQSYVNGLIDNGAPELAHKILMDGKLDDQLDPTHKQRLIQGANAGITAKRVASEHAEAQARRDEKLQLDIVNNDLMGKFVEGKLTVNDVRASGLPTFGEGSQNQWVTMLRTQAKEWAEKPIKTQPSVMVDAFERIGLPAGDPRRITGMGEINKLYIEQKVSWADLTHLQKAFKDQQTEAGQRLGEVKGEFLKGMKSQLDKSSMVMTDAGGGERMYRFTNYVNEQVAKAVADGKSNPYDLFNPASPQYLGKAVSQFQTGAQRQAVKITNQVNEAFEKSKKLEGESPADYLKRINRGG